MNTNNTLLFDKFFNDDIAINAQEDGSRESDKILLTHLQRLLNTRKQNFINCTEKNQASILGNYGLLDFGQFNPKSNQDKTHLQHAIEETLEKYEPRLHDVHVSIAESNALNMSLCFRIEAKFDRFDKELSLFLQLDQATCQATLEQIA